jgi:type I restriction enzyme, S subunit
MSGQLAEGWVRIKLPEVCALNPPKPPPASLPADASVSFVPMPAVDAEEGAIVNPVPRAFSEVRKGFTAFRDGDVIMAKITPCMENGKAAIARGLLNGLGFGSTEFHVLRSTGTVLPEYVYYFIRQESFRRSAEQDMTGSVGQKRVPGTFLEDAATASPFGRATAHRRQGRGVVGPRERRPAAAGQGAGDPEAVPAVGAGRGLLGTTHGRLARDRRERARSA